MTNRNIGKLFSDTGSILLAEKNPQTISGVIRELQSKLKEYESSSSESLIFLLNLILDDIFDNISGDNGYNNSMYDARDVIFKQVGKTLIVISEKVESLNELEIYTSFNELISTYLGALRKINSEFENQEYTHVTR